MFDWHYHQVSKQYITPVTNPADASVHLEGSMPYSTKLYRIVKSRKPCCWLEPGMGIIGELYYRNAIYLWPHLSGNKTYTFGPLSLSLSGNKTVYITGKWTFDGFYICRWMLRTARRTGFSFPRKFLILVVIHIEQATIYNWKELWLS